MGSKFGSVKAKRVLAALIRLGWTVARQTGSHRILVKEGCQPYTFAFHDGEEIGPRMMSRVARETGLRPEDL